MPFMLILIFTICLLIAGVGISNSFSQGSEKRPVTSQRIVNSSRSEIENMLKQIEKKDAPAMKMGAMCYEPVMSAEYEEYVCPLDGEKTVYDQKIANAPVSIRNIVEMRRLVEQINSETNWADLKLDESRLCSKCFPGLKSEDRYVLLVTKYPDGREHVYSKVSTEDLRILVGFFEEKLFYKTSTDGEVPLKDRAAQIREMLGTQEN